MPATSYFKKRVYIGQRGIDGDSWGVDDLTDIWALLDSAQGKDATVRSNFYFWDGALRFGRPSDLLYSYNIRTSIIDHNVDVYHPVVPSTINTDYFLYQDTPAEIKNKTITPETNTLTGIEKMPDYAKSGKFQGSNYKGEGIMESLVHLDLPELLGDSVEGSYARYSTPVTANQQTGFWVPNTYLTMGKFDPIIKMKGRLSDWAVSTNRFYFGLVSADNILQNDIPFGMNDSALLLGFRNADSDFKLFRGIGNGVSSTTPYSTQTNLGHATFELECGFEGEGTSVYFRINNGEKVTFSSNLPDNDRWLKLHCNIQNTTTETKDMDVFYSRIESKK